MIFFKDHRDKCEPFDFDADDGYLKGKLLVATTALQETYFSKAVILICDHEVVFTFR